MHGSFSEVGVGTRTVRITCAYLWNLTPYLGILPVEISQYLSTLHKYVQLVALTNDGLSNAQLLASDTNTNGALRFEQVEWDVTDTQEATLYAAYIIPLKEKHHNVVTNVVLVSRVPPMGHLFSCDSPYPFAFL